MNILKCIESEIARLKSDVSPGGIARSSRLVMPEWLTEYLKEESRNVPAE